MTAAGVWRAGIASDPGLQRSINEDRVFADDTRGVFLVVDGLGGHAAGETAAETAVRVVAEQTRPLDDGADPENVVRQAITEANNQIFALAGSNPDWRGMACVLTLAIAKEDRVVVGHVGDSRLYLAWNGTLRKITSDHSPVGEQEDDGQITEAEAMSHPRRNEVFRDVGSFPRGAADAQFIEVKNFLFRPDAALLLCSDGLSDLLTSAQIQSVIERFDGDPSRTAQRLVEAANQAGGKDNVSVVFVPGPRFQGSAASAALLAQSRHAITRARSQENGWRPGLRNAAWLVTGMLLGSLIWAGLERLTPTSPKTAPSVQGPRARTPAHVAVNSADAHGISKSIELALPGDTVDIPPGEYLGPIVMKSDVYLVGSNAGTVNLRSDPTSVNDPGIAVSARAIGNARIANIHIAGDETHPLRRGLSAMDSSLTIENVEVSGAIDAGMRLDGASQATLLANFIHSNTGAGLVINGHTAAYLAGNWISGNGRTAEPRGVGLLIESDALPRLVNNIILRNTIVKPGSGAAAFARDVSRINLLDTAPAREPVRAKPNELRSEREHGAKVIR